MGSDKAVVRSGSHRSGFTIPEVLAVMGVIALLIAVLLPALTGAKRSAQMADSMNRLRQIASWMTMYASENRDHIVPSQFDHTASNTSGYPVKVRSSSALTSTPWGDLQFKGTWTDILWTYSGEGKKQQVGDNPLNAEMYMFDSPDTAVYERDGSYDGPFRSAAANTRDFPISGAPLAGPKPFGPGAHEAGLAGYFAANNFFDARPTAPLYHPSYPPAGANGRWYVNGQIKAPDRAMYLVDSFAGETINPVCGGPYESDLALDTLEVDFRYNGMCLMLFLDGHAGPEGPWDGDVLELEQNRRIRIRNLTGNAVLSCP